MWRVSEVLNCITMNIQKMMKRIKKIFVKEEIGLIDDYDRYLEVEDDF